MGKRQSGKKWEVPPRISAEYKLKKIKKQLVAYPTVLKSYILGSQDRSMNRLTRGRAKGSITVADE